METLVVPIPLLQDNYGYLVHQGKKTLVIDPSEAGPVAAVLSERGWHLDAILNTHHHWDHVGGNAELKQIFGCEVWAPEGDEGRVPAADQDLPRDARVEVAGISFQTFFIPGHTRNHLAFWFETGQALFTGDTLFLMGCGRLFEGTAAQMWQSLGRLMQLPSETRVYCGHEYTEQNARFALSLTPDDGAVLLRTKSRVPGTLGEEKRTNPFLRLDDSVFRQKLFPGLGAVDAFARLREKKDRWN